MPKKGILLFAFTEITIGAATLAAVIQSLATHASNKPFNVLVFVIASSLISVSLGIGLILRAQYSRKLIIFFSGWIILSKTLVLAGIITLSGSIETALNPDIKNAISVLYHLIVILYFHHSSIKAEFEKQK